MKRISLLAGLSVILAGAVAWAATKGGDQDNSEKAERPRSVALSPLFGKAAPDDQPPLAGRNDNPPPTGPEIIQTKKSATAPATLPTLSTSDEMSPPEMKAAETQPAESKPAESKPAEMQSGDTKPLETKSVETKPAETKPAEAKSAEPIMSLKDIIVDGGMGQTNDNPTGRQEPAISIEWIGPPAAKVGQSVTYQIIVKNICASRVYQVVLHVRMPEGANVTAAEPKPVTEDHMWLWNIGTMEPRDEKRIDLQLVPGGTGTMACHAFVSFTGLSTARLEVRKPKLTIKTAAPKNVIAGDPATIMVTVANPGDATAESVKVKAILSDGLEAANGKMVEFDLGNLGPNDSRNVFVLCGARAAGEQKCEAIATADPKLTAEETTTIDVLKPVVQLTVTGPGMRYLDRHAVYTFKVSNPGTATANHVNLINEVPLGFKFVAASGGGRHDFVSRTVTWFLGDLPPEKTKEVKMELVAVNPGEHKNKAVVTAARGLRAESEALTRIEGLPALLMELVDLDDPVEVGAETSYEIRVTNTGTKTETNLQLTCTVPDKMDFRGAKCAAGCKYHVDGKEVTFEPLPKLAPRADAIYRVKVRGMAAGDLRFQARMKADGLTMPVLKEESTKVYGDEIESHGGPGEHKP
jgi:uncharacterized repeat protein (TIGR01451 family)